MSRDLSAEQPGTKSEGRSAPSPHPEAGEVGPDREAVALVIRKMVAEGNARPLKLRSEEAADAILALYAIPQGNGSTLEGERPHRAPDGGVVASLPAEGGEAFWSVCPQLEGVSTPEPSLSQMVDTYYARHLYDDWREPAAKYRAAMDRALSATPTPQKASVVVPRGQLHTDLMDAIHGDLMRQFPAAFTEEDGNSDIVIPATASWVKVGVSELAEAALNIAAPNANGVSRALAFLDACVKAGEMTPEGAENPCDVWQALAASSASTPSDGAVVGGETGWLIEHQDRPEWLTLKPAEALWATVFTKDSIEAIRFARRDDAEDYVRNHLDEAPVRITEHRWPNIARAEAATTRCGGGVLGARPAVVPTESEADSNSHIQTNGDGA